MLLMLLLLLLLLLFLVESQTTDCERASSKGFSEWEHI
jgi:competence protein ComGC